MTDFELKIKELQEYPDYFKTYGLKELMQEIEDDIEKKAIVWPLLPKSIQPKYKSIFEDVMVHCGDDFDKQFNIWCNTNFRIQSSHTEYYSEILNKVGTELRENGNPNLMISLLNNTGYGIIQENLDKCIKDLNTYSNLEESSTVFETIVELLDANPNITDGKQELVKSIQRCLDEHKKNGKIDGLIDIYGRKDDLDNLLKDEDYDTPYKFIMSQFKKYPRRIVKAIEDGELAEINEDTLTSILCCEPPVPAKSLLAVLERAHFYDEINEKKVSCRASSMAPTVFKKINDQMQYGSQCEFAYDTLKAEMNVATKFCYEKNKTFTEELGRTLSRCLADYQYTNNSVFFDVYCGYKNKIEEYIDRMPAVEETERLKLRFDKLTEEAKKHPEEVMSRNNSYNNVKFLGIESFLDGLSRLNTEKRNEYLKNPIVLTTEEYKKLLDYPTIPNDLTVSIECKNASEISVQDLEKINGRFTCQSLQFSDTNLGVRQTKPYTLDEYKMCREKIDELLKDVKIPPLESENREKVIFGQVMFRLAKHMKYNHEHVEKSDRVRNEIKAIENLPPEQQKDNSERLKALKEKEKDIDYTTPRNMIGGLLQQECVCAGYAEIVRNALACCGIECRYVSGFPEKKGEDGHAWNQVKLDGQWYNTDLTWARDAIVSMNETRDVWPGIMCLMANDESFNSGIYPNGAVEFRRGGHGEYSRNRGKEEKCAKRVALMDLVKYVNSTPEVGISYSQILNMMANNLRTGDIKEAVRIVGRDMKDMQRGTINDKFKDTRDR